MYIVRHIEDLYKIISIGKKYNSTVGFIPTMGALHEGHLALVRASREENALTVVSIFVNPTQFNDKSDLDRYPRTEKEDMVKLANEGTDILFLPDVNEIYPEKGFEMPPLDLAHLMNKLDGIMRPGHFEGVVQVVFRFLDLIRPDRLYMGLKDFQQQKIIGEMIRQTGMNIDLISLPTIREDNGLAMSSRNNRLSAKEKEKAAVIYQVLKELKESIQNGEEFNVAKKKGIAELERAGMRVEYILWVDERDLDVIDNQSDKSVVLVAVWMGEVRLIDNIDIRRN